MPSTTTLVVNTPSVRRWSAAVAVWVAMRTRGAVPSPSHHRRAGNVHYGELHMSLRVLITDGEQRSVVAAVRGLAAAGYAVTATASSHPAAAQWSRACARRLDVPSAGADGGSALAGMPREELERERYAAVIPGSDGALRALSRHRAQLEPLAP